ncbi:hypothetical protein Pint_21894 [Pistacia integerrima]|uniref:Uncharacterized protein n=1 Tax=Pistacia integerrima TaxID=434235 RepID=A0ACC0XCG4_9ROSI|nr:hypothetical protein Pint_21894 [Pistacia integerrima]
MGSPVQCSLQRDEVTKKYKAKSQRDEVTHRKQTTTWRLGEGRRMVTATGDCRLLSNRL